MLPQMYVRGLQNAEDLLRQLLLLLLSLFDSNVLNHGSNQVPRRS
jgi:hypothetical protein